VPDLELWLHHVVTSETNRIIGDAKRVAAQEDSRRNVIIAVTSSWSAWPRENNTHLGESVWENAAKALRCVG
jgi:hypothetical protein